MTEPTIHPTPISGSTLRLPGWLTTARVITCLVLLVIATDLLLFVMVQARLLAESLAVAILACELAGIGVIAGVIGAHHRKRGESSRSFTAYRVAVWCLFLAFFHAMRYADRKSGEDFIKNMKEQEEFFKRLNPGIQPVEKQVSRPCCQPQQEVVVRASKATVPGA